MVQSQFIVVLCIMPLTVGCFPPVPTFCSDLWVVPRSQKVLAQNAQQPLAVDLQFDATAAWQYAIDPATLKFSNVPPASGQLPSPVFDSGMSPLSINVTACPITWEIAGDTFAAAPPTSPACTGRNTTLTLTPFGVSAHYLLS